MSSLEPWHWRSLPLAYRSGSDVFQALFLDPGIEPAGTQPIATLLESPAIPDSREGRSPLAQFSICAGPPRQTGSTSRLWIPPVGQVLPTLERLLAGADPTNQNQTGPENLPFTGGWLGWLGYDVAWEIERLPRINPEPLPFPPAYWYEPDQFAVLDHADQVLWLAATQPDDLDRMEKRLWRLAEEASSGASSAFVSASLYSSILTPETTFPLRFVSDQATYEQAVLQAKTYIQAGDIFQANLSLRFSTHTTADSWSLYRALQQVNPSPFASYWQTPWGTVISCSPERLVQRQGDWVQTRPIAGTRPRGSTPEGDRRLAAELLDNAKENAEHIMLVDLERNDLGRVCTWGSVEVDELLTIERYSHVMHLVSNIRGRLRSPFSSVDLIRALFPGGTITGCPKVRCMEIIEELEPVRRNLFYGSCGYLDWRGHLDLNILIRTLLCTPTSAVPGAQTAISSPGNSPIIQTVWGQVGAGIVADSEPEREWHESLSKAQAQLAALWQVRGEHH